MFNRKRSVNMPVFAALLLILTFTLYLTGCEQSTPTEPTADKTAPKAEQVIVQESDDRMPPTPPISENFEGAPQISLFPRAGDYRPEETDERFPYWKTFIEHIVKTSGPTQSEQETGSISWAIRGIKTIDSVGFFSPLAVQPGTGYQVSVKIKTDLTEGASAGVGILEFSEFLWIGDQFTEAQMKRYATGSQEGARLTGTRDWEEQSFSFTTGPHTNMIHLVFFREGEHDRNPVLIDDISIKPL